MKILIADTFPQAQQESLAAHEITFNPALDEQTIEHAITDNEILIVRSTRVNAATLNAGTALKLVIRAGAGTNTIDKSSAKELGIRVCNVPGANSVAVAELAMGLILSIDRNIPDNNNDLNNGTWNKKKYSKARGLYGRNIGILGLGAIGFAVAHRATAFGMHVYAVSNPDRSDTSLKRITDAGITQLSSIDELLNTCDVISLHMPATADTTDMVNADFLNKMQDGAILINTSRGELINEQALLEAMESKGIRAGLDVYNNEPGAAAESFRSTLASHPNVCGTHHIGASTEQAQTAVAEGVLEVIEEYTNGHFQNCVN